MSATNTLEDARVTAALAQTDGSLTAADVAKHFGVSAVAATHCLQRLVKSGAAQVTAETVVKTGRVSEIVLHYQIKPRKTLGWPSWLDPRPLPAIVASVRRHMQPMTWGEDECETA